jgi:hypothetical protein
MSSKLVRVDHNNHPVSDEVPPSPHDKWFYGEDFVVYRADRGWIDGIGATEPLFKPQSRWGATTKIGPKWSYRTLEAAVAAIDKLNS